MDYPDPLEFLAVLIEEIDEMIALKFPKRNLTLKVSVIDFEVCLRSISDKISDAGLTRDQLQAELAAWLKANAEGNPDVAPEVAYAVWLNGWSAIEKKQQSWRERPDAKPSSANSTASPASPETPKEEWAA